MGPSAWEGLFLGTVEDTTQPYDLMVQCLPIEVKLNNCVGLSPACIVNNVHREYGIVRSLLLCSALHFRALSVWGSENLDLHHGFRVTGWLQGCSVSGFGVVGAKSDCTGSSCRAFVCFYHRGSYGLGLRVYEASRLKEGLLGSVKLGAFDLMPFLDYG